MPVELLNMETIRQRNVSAGQHFFDAATMRFFRSRLPEYGYTGPGGTFFVTSEAMDGLSARFYTVREQHVTGSVSTASDTSGTVYRCGTKAAASHIARARAAGDEVTA